MRIKWVIFVLEKSVANLNVSFFSFISLFNVIVILICLCRLVILDLENQVFMHFYHFFDWHKRKKNGIVFYFPRISFF